MNKFTKGPWTYTFGKIECEDWGIIRCPDGGIVATAGVYAIERDKTDLNAHRKNGTDPSAANAHLIAAAPEMYEALRRADMFIANGVELGYITLPDVHEDPATETPNLIKAALAKAAGENL